MSEPKVIQMPSKPDADPILQAWRQVESMVAQERAQTTPLKQALAELQARLDRETVQAKSQLAQYAASYNSLKSQYQSTESRLQQVTAHAQKLQQYIASQRTSTETFTKNIQLELQVAKASVQRLTQTHRALEDQLTQLRPELARAQSDVARAQAEMLERDHKLQSAMMSASSQEKANQETIAALKDSLRRAQNEIAQHKDRWIDAERMKANAEIGMRRQDELHRRLKEVTDANATLSEQIKLEKRRREQADTLARSAEQEKRQALAAVRANEERIVAAEGQLAKVSTELALLKAVQTSANMKLKRTAAIPASTTRQEFEGLEDLAVMGYPVVRGPMHEV